jgi:DNA-binding NarL/FixJ family response regulator
MNESNADRPAWYELWVLNPSAEGPVMSCTPTNELPTKNGYHLSKPELAILQLIAGGDSDDEIASTLSLSLAGVDAAVASILMKMRAGSRTEAGVRAIRENLVPW